MDAGEPVDHIVLGQHDFMNFRKVFRLMVAHPQELGRGKAREGDIPRQRQELLLTEVLVHGPGLLAGPAVVPENGRTNDLVLLVQHHQAVHLTAHRQALDLGRVRAVHQLGNTGLGSGPPVCRVLLRPAGLREFQRIGSGRRLADHAPLVHQQDLHRGGPQVNAEIQHVPHLLLSLSPL